MGRHTAVLTRIGPGRTRPFTLSLTTSVAIQGLNAVTGVLLARLLGPAGRGELAAVLLWPSVLAAVGSLGVSEAVVYETARGATPARAVAGSSLAVAVVQSLALVVAGMALVALVHRGDDPQLVRSSYLFLAFIPLNLLTLYATGIVNGLRRFAAYNGLRLMVIVATTGGIILVATADTLTVRTAIVVYLLANLLTAVAALVVLARLGTLSLACDRGTVWRLLSFGIRTHTTNIAAQLNERLDQLVISVILTPAKLGLYVIAVTLTSATTIIGQAAANVVLPLVASADDDEARTAAARRYVRRVLLGAAAIAVPMIVATPWLIRLLFGADFLGAATVTRVLLVATVFFSTNRVIAALLNAVGRPLDAAVAESLSLGITVVGLAVLLPQLDLAGAGLTSLLAYSATTVWMTVKAARALAMTPLDLLLGVGGPTRAGAHGG
jgi:O-antigen/teichoic acid export membrane protein